MDIHAEWDFITQEVHSFNPTEFDEKSTELRKLLFLMQILLNDLMQNSSTNPLIYHFVKQRYLGNKHDC